MSLINQKIDDIIKERVKLRPTNCNHITTDPTICAYSNTGRKLHCDSDRLFSIECQNSLKNGPKTQNGSTLTKSICSHNHPFSMLTVYMQHTNIVLSNAPIRVHTAHCLQELECFKRLWKFFCRPLYFVIWNLQSHVQINSTGIPEIWIFNFWTMYVLSTWRKSKTGQPRFYLALDFVFSVVVLPSSFPLMMDLVFPDAPGFGFTVNFFFAQNNPCVKRCFVWHSTLQ